MTISSQQTLQAQRDSYLQKAEQFGRMALWRLLEEPLDIPTAQGAYLFARRAFHFALSAQVIDQHLASIKG